MESLGFTVGPKKEGFVQLIRGRWDQPITRGILIRAPDPAKNSVVYARRGEQNIPLPPTLFYDASPAFVARVLRQL